MNKEPIVNSDEQIARILHPEWVVDDEVQYSAFVLSNGETYLSVNRLIVDTYAEDINDFINKHPNYKVDGNAYHRALLEVGDVRDMNVDINQKVANLTVEVEPRDMHYKSHAGVFVRVDDKNVKGGQKVDIVAEDGDVISYDDIRQKVSFGLLQLATLEKVQFLKPGNV